MQISITQFFDQIFIINLVERRDRRHEMELQLKKIGIYLPNDKVKFFPAIRPKVLAGFPSIGAKGCFLSHLNVLGPVAELVGIEGGVVSGVFNLESSDVGASDRRPRHEESYHEV